jgi:hypothetical protein
MFHRHIVALFNHGVFVRNVSTWSDSNIRARLIDIAVEAFVFESTLTCVEYDSILEMLISWLAESAWTTVSLD